MLLQLAAAALILHAEGEWRDGCWSQPPAAIDIQTHMHIYMSPIMPQHQCSEKHEDNVSCCQRCSSDDLTGSCVYLYCVHNIII